MFHDVLDKKKLFQSKKVTTFQKAKNRIFPNGLTHDFSQKIQNVSFSFWGENDPRNMFHDDLDKKETILE